MKLAISGKGGVGKTTVSILLAAALRDKGRKVVLIDADPNTCLLAAMGFPHPEEVNPLIEHKELIAERTGVEPGTTGGMYRLNPKVDDIADAYGVAVDGIKVLVAGALKKGGSGCYCPENAFLRALVAHLLTDPKTALVLDMEAGIEHLSRGTVESVDSLLVVVDSGRRSLETAERIRRMAGEIGIKRISAIGNRIKSDDDKDFLTDALPILKFVGFVPYDGGIVMAERDGVGVGAGVGHATRRAVDSIVMCLGEQTGRA